VEFVTVTVETADGRTLEVLTSGPDDGLTLLFHWGTPQGAVPFGILERPAAARRLRVVSYSRPGYGRSSPRPDGAAATVADDAADAAVVLDYLGLHDFVTLGWSGGGPRAIACAALLPGRCLAAASGAGVAPSGVQGLDFLAGMGPENIEEFEAAMAGAEALEDWLSRNGPSTFAVTAEDVIASFGQLLSEVDKAALTGELAERVAESLRRAGQQGIVGWRDDDLTLMRPWGFDLTAIEVPVSVWQGAQDKMVPYAHGGWLAEHIPGARAHLYDNEGHISLITQMDRILDDLLECAGWPAKQVPADHRPGAVGG
jgi:pimeloyl-ACP methyl ester carboxylesterase